MSTITASGVELYYELRGTGPSVLLIHGGGVGSGTFSRLAEMLAHDFMVVSYDRRGVSGSPRPKDWQQNSMAEQAEDAAGLMTALGLAVQAANTSPRSGSLSPFTAKGHARSGHPEAID